MLTDVSGQPVGPILISIEDGNIGCTEISVITTARRITTQKSAVLICFPAKAGNHDWSTVGFEKLVVLQLVSKFVNVAEGRLHVLCCAPILYGWSNQEEWDGLGMWHA